MFYDVVVLDSAIVLVVVCVLVIKGKLPLRRGASLAPQAFDGRSKRGIQNTSVCREGSYGSLGCYVGVGTVEQGLDCGTWATVEMPAPVQ